MSFWRTLGSVFGVGVDSSGSSSTTQFDDTDSATNSIDDHCVNPATGLPMVGGMGGVDVHGNPFGTDMNEHQLFSNDDSSSELNSCTLDDSFTDTSSVFDDSISSSFDDSFSSHNDW